MFKKCSWSIDNQEIEFLRGANYRSKNRNDFSRGANHCLKIQGESASKVNYHSKNRVDQNNRCHENAGTFRLNIISSEISSKSHEKPGISSRFVCITFAQYCIFIIFIVGWGFFHHYFLQKCNVTLGSNREWLQRTWEDVSS